LAVTFVAPAGWRGGDVHIRCTASGQRKVLWINQPATLGQEADVVRLYLASRGTLRQVAKPVSQAEWSSKRPEARDQNDGDVPSSM
jgi:hypothetical protein